MWRSLIVRGQIFPTPSLPPIVSRVLPTKGLPPGGLTARGRPNRDAEARGCAAIHVSTGGLTPAQQIPLGPSYQVPLARAVKKATRIPVIAVGLITEFEQAEAIVGTGMPT